MKLLVVFWKRTLTLLGYRCDISRRRRRRSEKSTCGLAFDGLEPRRLLSADEATLSFLWNEGASVEGQFQAITVQLDSPHVTSVTALLTPATSSTSSNSDFWLSQNSVTFQPGETLQTVIVTLDDDNYVEGPESYTIALSTESESCVVAPTSVLFVGQVNEPGDDDPPRPGGPPVVNFVELTRAEMEGSGYEVLLSLSAPSSQVVYVTVQSSNGSAIEGLDFVFDDVIRLGGSVTFWPGQTLASVHVDLLPDDLEEGTENFFLTITQAFNATIGRRYLFTGLIGDEDSGDLPEVNYAVSSMSEIEGDVFSLELTLSKVSRFPVRVTVAHVDGTAEETKDYYVQLADDLRVTGQSTFTFMPGTLSQRFDVYLVDDELIEPTEDFLLPIIDVIGAIVGQDSTFFGLIGDGDSPGGPWGPGGPGGSIGGSDPRVYFGQTRSEGVEGEVVDIEVRLSRPVNREVVATIQYRNGTATFGADYGLYTQVVVFTPNSTATEFYVDLKRDRNAEPTETYFLDLVSAVNANIGTVKTLNGLIKDEQGPSEISVFDITANQQVSDGSGIVNYGTVAKNQTAIHRFRITNNGQSELVVHLEEDSLPVGFEFVGGAPGVMSIGKNGGNFEFAIGMKTDQEGSKRGEVVFENNTQGETNPFNFRIQGIVNSNLPLTSNRLPPVVIPEDFSGVFQGFNLRDYFGRPELGSAGLQFTIVRIDKSAVSDVLNNVPDPQDWPADYFPPKDATNSLLVDPVIKVSANSEGWMTFELEKNTYGFSQFMVSATDELGEVIVATMFVKVTPVNDAPKLRSGIANLGTINFGTYPQKPATIVSDWDHYVTGTPHIIDLWSYFHDNEDSRYLKFTVTTQGQNIFAIGREPKIDPGKPGRFGFDQKGTDNASDGILAFRFGRTTGAGTIIVTGMDRAGESFSIAFKIKTVPWEAWYDHWYNGWYTSWYAGWSARWTDVGKDPPSMEDGTWAGKAQFLEIGGHKIDSEYVELNDGFGEQGLVSRNTTQLDPSGNEIIVNQLLAQHNLERDRDIRNVYSEFVKIEPVFDGEKSPLRTGYWWDNTGHWQGYYSYGWSFNQNSGLSGQWEFDLNTNWQEAWAKNSSVVGKPMYLSFGSQWTSTDGADKVSFAGAYGGKIKFEFEAEKTKLWVPASMLYMDDDPLYPGYGFGFGNGWGPGWAGRGPYGWNGSNWGWGPGGIGYDGPYGFAGGGELRQIESGHTYNLNPWGGWGGYGWGGYGWGGNYWGGWFGGWESSPNGEQYWPSNAMPIFVEAISVDDTQILDIDLTLHSFPRAKANGQGYEFARTEDVSTQINFGSGNFAAGFFDSSQLPITSNGPSWPVDFKKKSKDLTVNSIDADGDAVPDFHDGYNLDGLGGYQGGIFDDQNASDARTKFEEIVVKIPNQIRTDALINFSFTTAGAGAIRLWKTNSETRDARDILNGGDLIKSTDSIFGFWEEGIDNQPHSQRPYKLSELGITAQNRHLRLYVEALTPGRSEIVIRTDARGHGPILMDTLSVTNNVPVTIFAIDAYGAEATVPDPVTFRISRNVFNSQDPTIDVFFRLKVPDRYVEGTNEERYSFKSANSQLWENRDFVIDSTDPDNLIGVVKLNTFVDISLRAIDDQLVEWDERIEIELLTREEVMKMTLRPVESRWRAGIFAPPHYLVTGENGIRHALPFTSSFGTSFYSLTANSTSAYATILDNDGIQTQSRSVEWTSGSDESTGVAVQYATLNTRDGHTSLNLPVDLRLPQFNANDNLRPIFVVLAKLPRDGETSSGISGEVLDPIKIEARVTFAGFVNSQLHTFDVTNLSTTIANDPDSLLRFVVTAPDGLQDILPTGTYEYDIEFTLFYSGKPGFYAGGSATRTIRGTTEFINRVNVTFGGAELGKRWTLPELDRLYFSMGQTLPGGNPYVSRSDGTSSVSRISRTASPYVERGANPFSGITLVRGDNSTAFYGLSDFNLTPATNIEPTFKNRDAWRQLPDGSYRASGKPAGPFNSEVYNEMKWTFDGLNPNEPVFVGIDWRASRDNASNVPVSVSGAIPIGGRLTENTYYINQRFGHSGDYLMLGVFVPTAAGKIVVTLSAKLPEDEFDPSYGYVSANKVYVGKSQWSTLGGPSSNSKIVTPPGTFSKPSHQVVNDPSPRFYVEILSHQTGVSYQFNTIGVLEAAVDKYGNQTRYEYADLDGDQLQDDLIRITLPGDLTYHYTYSGSVLRTVTDPVGRVTTFSSSAGSINTLSLPATGTSESAQQRFTFEYDAQFRIKKVTNGRLHATSFSYADPFGFKSTVANPDGRVFRVASELGFPFATVYPLNSIFTSSFLDQNSFSSIKVLNANSGKVLSSDDNASATDLYEGRAFVVDGRGNISRYQSDGFGLITAFVDETGTRVWLTDRNKHGQATRFVEPAGYIANLTANPNLPDSKFIESRITKHDYDQNHNLTSTTSAEGTPDALTESWTHQLLGDKVWVVDTHTATDQRGTKFTYDSSTKFATEITENFTGPGASRTTKYTYTPKPTATNRLPAGLVKTAEVDGQTSSTFYFGESSSDPVHLIGLVRREIVEKNGVSWTIDYEYDALRNLTRKTEPGNVVTHYVFDGLNQLLAEEFSVQSYVPLVGNPSDFDANGIPVATDGTSRPKVRYQYDAAGNRTKAIELLWRNPETGFETKATTTYSFDPMNRVESTTAPSPGGASTHSPLLTQYVYDENGNQTYVTTTVNGSARVVEYQYDDVNQLIKEIHPAPSFGTDVPGNLIPVESMVRAVVRHEYDSYGNLIRTTDARFGLNSDGSDNLAAPGTRYYFDIHGRLAATVQDVDGSAGHSSPVQKFEYDQAGRLVKSHQQIGTAAGQFAVTTREYDGLGRLRKITEPPTNEGLSRVTTIESDLFDNPTRTTIEFGSNSQTIESRYYDGLNRLIGIDHADPGNGVVGLVTLFGYDLFGFIAAKLVYPGSIVVSGFETARTVSQLAEMARSFTTGNVKVQFTRYRNDRLGNVIAEVSPDQNGETTGNNNLSIADTSVVSLFTYDLSGNQVQSKVVFQDIPSPSTNPIPSTGALVSLTTDTAYDNLNRPWNVLGPVNAQGDRPETITLYNADDTVSQTQTKTKIALGQLTWANTDFGYDSLGRLTRIAMPGDANERVTGLSFQDANGNVVRTVDSQGWTTDFAFDYLNRLTAKKEYVDRNGLVDTSVTIHPTLETKSFYSANGLLVWQTLPDGRSTSIRYDDAGNVTYRADRESDVNDSVVRLESYVANGMPGEIRNSQETTTVTYDRIGHVLTERVSDVPTRLREFKYDSFGNLIAKTNRNGEETNYEYYHTGLLKAEYWSDAGYTKNFDYTPLGELRRASDHNDLSPTKNSDFTYTYDSSRALANWDRFFNGLDRHVKSSFIHDNLRRKHVETVSLDGVTAFTNSSDFDVLGRKSFVQQTGPAVIGTFVDFGYKGERKELVKYGQTEGSATQFASVKYSYFDDGRLRESKSNQNSETFETQSNKYDRFGREVSVTFTSPAPYNFSTQNIVRSFEDFSRPSATNAAVDNYGRGFVASQYGRVPVNFPQNIYSPSEQYVEPFDAEGNAKIVIDERPLAPALDSSLVLPENYPGPISSQEFFRLNQITSAGSLSADLYALEFDAINLPSNPVIIKIWSGWNSLGISELISEQVLRRDNPAGPARFVVYFRLSNASAPSDVYFGLYEPNGSRINIPAIGHTELSAISKISYLDWNRANQLTRVTSRIQAFGPSYQFDGEAVEFKYDVLGNMISAEQQFVNGITGVPSTRRLDYVADVNGIRQLTFLERKLVGVSLNDAQGQTYVINEITETFVNQIPSFTSSSFVRLISDTAGTVRFLSDLDGVSAVIYLTGARPRSLFNGFSGSLEPYELASFFRGYEVDANSGVYFHEGRPYSASAQLLFSENHSAIYSGSQNLYQRTQHAPTGEREPELWGFNYFAQEKAILSSFVAEAAGPVSAVAQGIGGLVQVIGGSVYSAATGGWGALFGGGFVIARGLDDLQAAFRTLYSGERVETFTYDVTKAVTGSEFAARGLEIGTGLVSPAFAAKALMTSGQVAKAAVNANAVSRYVYAGTSSAISRSYRATTQFAADAHQALVATLRQPSFSMNAGSILVDAFKNLSKIRGAPSSEASRGLSILNREFIPDTQRVLQNATNLAVTELGGNPSIARDLMSAGSYRHLVQSTGLADASYGKAVERLTANTIAKDESLSSILHYQSSPFVSTPDFYGYDGLNLRLLEITTQRAIPRHQTRSYGSALEFVTHPGLPKNLVFPR